ncbi:sigma-54-dependent Fis family transcriptional regulator [Ammoniphilus sp. CFH 90114]|uniref:sigma-54-dependent Fis family transcriptional regulator n=1 Tax=Ammoniphilus sp. CFH 90114 TaxID=2493665 RepID=UPI00100E63CE|nr:sigma-54-dependent Fis family transcriptional regulator [Ammoniphilus sp. CFH 90114]RXT07234.1 sigma-54-dependent Fis family transcriptional regulator [Ammoniphilus sp. CFH 90114]
MREYYDRYAELLHYSSPILEDMFQDIAGTEFLVLVATPDGYVINSMGNPTFLQEVDRVALCRGANWLEKYKGTNAIGTAITEKKPVVVHGRHHYCRDNHFLTCTASPIFGPSGELLGVLNMSSYKHDFHPYSLGLVKRAAQTIEQALYIADMKKGQKEHSWSGDLDFIYDHHPSSLITVSEEGIITRMNFSASKIVGSKKVGESVAAVFEQLDTSSSELAKDRKLRFKNHIFTTHIVSGSQDGRSQFILRGEKMGQHGELTNRYSFQDILCDDPKMKETIEMARKVALLDINVMLSGESGTGKELFSQSLHGASLRSDKPFIAINCSAIPESLLESELFGYEKGAFTGAKSGGQAGKFEAADEGTLFLDEIGDMPLAAQATLLRVIQERCVTRIGGISPRPVNVRIIAATHKDLLKEIEAGRFRADLYYRLNGFTLKLPALRERSDLLLLAEHVLSHLPFAKTVPILSEEAKSFIQAYDWPGNFRQLQNVLQQAALLADSGQIQRDLLASLCPSSVTIEEESVPEPKPEKAQEENEAAALRSLKWNEATCIKQTLDQVNGNISQAAKLLNIGRNTLYRKLRTYNISL